jgi:hypothetical protein
MRGILLAILALATASALATEPPVLALLPQQAYVWQRAWTPGLIQSLARHADSFDRLILLQAEVSWTQGQPHVITVPADFAALRALKRPVGLALRIGACPASQSEKATPWLADLARGVVENVRTNGVPVSELQIDFDCAESKLDRYRAWIIAIRKQITPTPLVFTALPSWLKRDAFTPLARSADGFVLQVHSLDRPKSPQTPFQLCDPVAAQRSVQKADESGVPFRVALPTYGYCLAFDTNNRFIGLSAEGPRMEWPETVKTLEIRADPTAMANLVHAWTLRHPAHFQGIIWYRLPVPGERLNWAWPTLATVMKGTVPTAHLETRISTTKNSPKADAKAGLIDLFLVNSGSAPPASPPTVTVRWPQGSRLIACDAQNEFTLRQTSPTTLVFTAKRSTPEPDERLKIGWLRFETAPEVQLEITP